MKVHDNVANIFIFYYYFCHQTQAQEIRSQSHFSRNSLPRTIIRWLLQQVENLFRVDSVIDLSSWPSPRTNLQAFAST
jgi:hypothetical protein